MSGGQAPRHPFDWNPVLLRTLFLARGYDVVFDNAWPGDESGSITGRREHGLRAHLVVVDAGGRFGARVTVTSTERGREAEIDGIPVRVTDTEQRLAVVSGRLDAPADLERVLAGLDAAATPDESTAAAWPAEPPPPL